jgi:hypothetical protein
MISVAWYRFRVTFGHRWGGYLSVVLLIGLVGGVAMGAVAGARRTQSSFPTFLASTNPSNLSLGTALYNPEIGYNTGYNESLVQRIARLPGVDTVKSYAGLNGYPLPSKDSNANVSVLGSVDGQYFTQDRVTVITGRMPTEPNEMVMTAKAAEQLDLQVGDVVPYGFFTNAQLNSASSTTPTPHLRIVMKLVGIVVFNDEVVQDDVDKEGSQPALFTTALTRRLLQCCTGYSFSYLQLQGGNRELGTVEAEIQRIFPKSLPFDPHAMSIVETKAERAIKPETLALGVFGGIAALAALLLAAQMIGRQLQTETDDLGTLRALGADPPMTMADGLLGIIGAVVLGSLVACVVAVGLSPLSPIGPVRSVYPTPGIAFDWTVLGFGLLVLIVGLSALAFAFAYREAPHRVARRSPRTKRSSVLARSAATSGMPISEEVGIRFALQPGTGRTAVPVRSAIVGAALAITVVIATVTFGASLNTLVSHPVLYGWNWNYELNGGGGVGDIPQQQSAALLDNDRYVDAWAGGYFGNLQIDGQTVPVLGQSPNAKVQPPILSGHGLEKPNQVVLGAATLTQLHKRLGDTVEVRYEFQKPTRLVIVGTATMPTIGIAGVDVNHLSMGVGAVLSSKLIPESVTNSFRNSPVGPNVILVDLKDGVDPASSLRSLRRIAGRLTLPTNYGVGVLSVQRPAEIVNYRSMGSTPAILGAGLAAGAVIGLGLTLVASVRRRRRDMALFKTLGFTKRQLAAVIAWQASAVVAIGTIVGVPLGIVLGRGLWDLFAHEINAVPAPSVPVLTIVLIAIGGLVFANLVAAIPGRIAARTPTALLLRAE